MARDSSSSSFDRPSPRGVPSGSRETMTGPDEGRGPENRLHGVDLEDRGESLDDHQRDRGSRGTGDYDDSLERRTGDTDADRVGVARGD